MYIGTDLFSKSGLAEKLDKLDFTFSISSNSIPLLDRYGVNINASAYTIYDIAPEEINKAISNLNDAELSVSNININGRTINADIRYQDKLIGVSTSAIIR